MMLSGHVRMMLEGEGVAFDPRGEILLSERGTDGLEISRAFSVVLGFYSQAEEVYELESLLVRTLYRSKAEGQMNAIPLYVSDPKEWMLPVLQLIQERCIKALLAFIDLGILDPKAIHFPGAASAVEAAKHLKRPEVAEAMLAFVARRTTNELLDKLFNAGAGETTALGVAP